MTSTLPAPTVKGLQEAFSWFRKHQRNDYRALGGRLQVIIEAMKSSRKITWSQLRQLEDIAGDCAFENPSLPSFIVFDPNSVRSMIKTLKIYGNKAKKARALLAAVISEGLPHEVKDCALAEGWVKDFESHWHTEATKICVWAERMSSSSAASSSFASPASSTSSTNQVTPGFKTPKSGTSTPPSTSYSMGSASQTVSKVIKQGKGKRIQIQSAIPWLSVRSLVNEELCRRLSAPLVEDSSLTEITNAFKNFVGCDTGKGKFADVPLYVFANGIGCAGLPAEMVRHTHTHTRTHPRIRTHARTHTRTHTSIHAHVYAYTHSPTH